MLHHLATLIPKPVIPLTRFFSLQGNSLEYNGLSTNVTLPNIAIASSRFKSHSLDWDSQPDGVLFNEVRRDYRACCWSYGRRICSFGEFVYSMANYPLFLLRAGGNEHIKSQFRGITHFNSSSVANTQLSAQPLRSRIHTSLWYGSGKNLMCELRGTCHSLIYSALSSWLFEPAVSRWHAGYIV